MGYKKGRYTNIGEYQITLASSNSGSLAKASAGKKTVSNPAHRCILGAFIGILGHFINNEIIL